MGPLFQSHGTADGIVPIRFGRELFDAAPTTQKRFVEFADRGHNDPEPASYYRELAAFLDEVDRHTIRPRSNVATNEPPPRGVVAMRFPSLRSVQT